MKVGPLLQIEKCNNIKLLFIAIDISAFQLAQLS